MDVLEGLRLYLLANESVSTLTEMIFEPELALSEDDVMPQAVVVLKSSGGAGSPLQIQINKRRLITMCYGATPHLANSLDDVVYLALKALSPSVWAQTYIHTCNEGSGPIGLRDPETQWPYTTRTYTVIASDLTVS